MPITVHHITTGNMDLLANVAPDVFDHDIQPALLAAYAADKRHGLFVAMENSTVIGHIRGNIHLQPDRAPDLYIDNLGTDTTHHRRGIATLLMKAMLAWGKAQGCTFAWVATETDNDGAIGYYAAQRFSHGTMAMFSLEMDTPP